MEECGFQENLADIPFAPLLFSIWQREKYGCLKLRKNKVEKRLCLEKGKIVVKRGTFPEKDSLKKLVKKTSGNKHEQTHVKNLEK